MWVHKDRYGAWGHECYNQECQAQSGRQPVEGIRAKRDAGLPAAGSGSRMNLPDRLEHQDILWIVAILGTSAAA
ncbi:MAG: hypothetical protein WC406_11260, partial [Methanoregula sp.]